MGGGVVFIKEPDWRGDETGTVLHSRLKKMGSDRVTQIEGICKGIVHPQTDFLLFQTVL